MTAYESGRVSPNTYKPAIQAPPRFRVKSLQDDCDKCVSLGSYIPTPDTAVRFRIKSLHVDCDKYVERGELNEREE